MRADVGRREILTDLVDGNFRAIDVGHRRLGFAGANPASGRAWSPSSAALPRQPAAISLMQGRISRPLSTVVAATSRVAPQMQRCLAAIDMGIGTTGPAGNLNIVCAWSR